MIMEEELQERNNNLSLDDIDLSLLRLTSPPYDYSPPSSLFSADEITPPLKRASPVSDESDLPKRRKLSPQNPIFTTSPPLFTSPETQTSSVHDTSRYTNLTSSVSEKQEATPSVTDTETMKMVNKCVEVMNRGETNYAYEKEQEELEEEEDCGGGMRIERSGDGFVIRLKCRCRQAFRVLFSDDHLYFKPL
ncbi:gem-associated-like protein [Arabidopsis thaliana]|uniref:Gem-associated-like protein n=1 Tax=Arabidopsis thaliana TaxID=3702 RepID=F4ITW2_ARATH|nr:gem-associated-like protein [Arabidopsis thaliana]AEC09570.1 gem-associated-like protein [Arabidopsis thaliana]|eukprot:NP_181403.2 gem-associated-like protein [Arabidopsis thaliana]